MNLARGAIGALLWLILAGAAAAAPPRARIETGTVVGARSGPAEVFRAIPYAAPPLGSMRWAPPAPALHWRGERAAIAPGPACAQKIYPGGAPNLGGYNGPISEDCLTLDVTAPIQARHAPVMVWIYGGGNVAGATNLPSYDAVNFARDGVIVVAMNYRLGSLGFFAHPALTKAAPTAQPLYNYGLMDQIAALEWVKRNITAFGGDPAKVTVFGESAGGANVLALMATPSARGLFQRAIVQSGGGWGAPGPQATFADREAAGAALASKLGLPGAAASADQAQVVSLSMIDTPERAVAITLRVTDPASFLEHQAPAFLQLLDDPRITLVGHYVGLLNRSGQLVWDAFRLPDEGGDFVIRSLAGCNPISNEWGGPTRACPAP